MGRIPVLGRQRRPRVHREDDVRPRDTASSSSTRRRTASPSGPRSPGWYHLEDHEAGTHLAVKLEVCVDLPLPKVSTGSVNNVMGRVMTRMGDRFSANLLRKLDAQRREPPLTSRARTSAGATVFCITSRCSDGHEARAASLTAFMCDVDLGVVGETWVQRGSAGRSTRWVAIFSAVPSRCPRWSGRTRVIPCIRPRVGLGHRQLAQAGRGAVRRRAPRRRSGGARRPPAGRRAPVRVRASHGSAPISISPSGRLVEEDALQPAVRRHAAPSGHLPLPRHQPVALVALRRRGLEGLPAWLGGHEVTGLEALVHGHARTRARRASSRPG